MRHPRACSAQRRASSEARGQRHFARQGRAVKPCEDHPHLWPHGCRDLPKTSCPLCLPGMCSLRTPFGERKQRRRLRWRGRCCPEHPAAVGQPSEACSREGKDKAAPTVHRARREEAGGQARGQERGPRGPRGGAANAAKPEPGTRDLDPHLPARGPRLDPQSGTQTPCASCRPRIHC